MNTTEDKAIAEEIARQLGPLAFRMMGTRTKFYDGPALIFDLRGSKHCNKIKVALNGNDLYDITFYKIGRAPTFTVNETRMEDVYAEDMAAIIERHTKLFLSFGR